MKLESNMNEKLIPASKSGSKKTNLRGAERYVMFDWVRVNGPKLVQEGKTRDEIAAFASEHIKHPVNWVNLSVMFKILKLKPRADRQSGNGFEKKRTKFKIICNQIEKLCSAYGVECEEEFKNLVKELS